jgi:hypothetical protein
MEKCIDDIRKAIKEIDSLYIEVIGKTSEGNAYEQAAEAAFTAELYHQYKTIIARNDNGYYSNLILHYDLTKQGFNGQRPDLVLHKGPDNRDDQRLYIEIKTSRITNNYKSDFDKLFRAVSEENKFEYLGFKNAVFLTAKSNYEDVKNSIIDYIRNNNLISDTRKNKIYSIHLEQNLKITVTKFSEII